MNKNVLNSLVFSRIVLFVGRHVYEQVNDTNKKIMIEHINKNMLENKEKSIIDLNELAKDLKKVEDDHFKIANIYGKDSLKFKEINEELFYLSNKYKEVEDDIEYYQRFNIESPKVFRVSCFLYDELEGNRAPVFCVGDNYFLLAGDDATLVENEYIVRTVKQIVSRETFSNRKEEWAKRPKKKIL